MSACSIVTSFLLGLAFLQLGCDGARLGARKEEERNGEKSYVRDTRESIVRLISCRSVTTICILHHRLSSHS